MSMVAVLIAEAAEGHVSLPMPPFMYGVVAAVILAIFGFVMFSYRDVANRHSHSSSAAARPGGAGREGHDATASGHTGH